MIIYQFESLDQMAAFFAKKGADIRARVSSASRESSKNAMRAEAHAYEQAASIIQNSTVNLEAAE